MVIGGFLKQSLIEFRNHVSCVIFTQGCNFRCPFCHNPELISEEKGGEYSLPFIFNYLKKYNKWIDAVVITGGEPTLQPDLYDVIKDIKSLGFNVKLEQNGSNPEVLKKIMPLLDFIQMDIKSTMDSYQKWVDSKIDINAIKESVSIIKKSNVPFEFVTTITKWHTPSIIARIRKEFQIQEENHRLQKFKNTKILNIKKLNELINNI